MKILVINASARKNGFCDYISNNLCNTLETLSNKTEKFSNNQVIKNINRYFKNYSIITHTHYNYLGFFHHLNHHSVKNDGQDEQFKQEISRIAKIIVKQKIDYDLLRSSQNPYAV